MTDKELSDIFKVNIDLSPAAALRGVYNAGWYAGAGQTPAATSADKSINAAKPVAVVKLKGIK